MAFELSFIFLLDSNLFDVVRPLCSTGCPSDTRIVVGLLKNVTDNGPSFHSARNSFASSDFVSDPPGCWRLARPPSGSACVSSPRGRLLDVSVGFGWEAQALAVDVFESFTAAPSARGPDDFAGPGFILWRIFRSKSGDPIVPLSAVFFVEASFEAACFPELKAFFRFALNSRMENAINVIKTQLICHTVVVTVRRFRSIAVGWIIRHHLKHCALKFAGNE